MDDKPQTRRYFSERHGRGPKATPLSFDQLRRLVVNVLDDFVERGYFQEAFGYECVDAGQVDGTLGRDPAAYFMRTIMRENVWPFREPPPSGGYFVPAGEEPEFPPDNWELWDEDTMFDVIEVMHDLVSTPVKGTYHSYSDCGWHYETFNRTAGQEEFRSEMNKVLRLGDPAYEMDGLGQIIESAPEEFRMLLGAPVPPGTEHNLITSKIDAAVTRFRTRGASIDDRRHAVRDLADVLEALRPDIKESMLSADEGALYNIANNFAIRHNNRQQKGDYDRVTWLRWTFYVYLATIHAVLRIRTAQGGHRPGGEVEPSSD
jgi:hypothetical protein